MYRMFRFYYGKNVPLYQMNLKYVETMAEAFEGAKAAIDFSGIATTCTPKLKKTTKMFSMYSNKYQNLWLKWMDMSGVTDTSSMFSEVQVSSIDISNWDVGNVEMASSMFYMCRCKVNGLGATEHENGGLNWKSVKCMDKMFCSVKWQFGVDVIATEGTVHNVDRIFIDSEIARLNIRELNLNNVSYLDAGNMFHFTRGRLYLKPSLARRLNYFARMKTSLDIYVE